MLYLRQSVYREDSVSLEIQETINRDYCARRGYQVVAVEADPGVSGTKVDRPGFKRVTALLDQHAAEVVVAWKWSRYFRHRLHFNVALHEIESRGGQVESATEPVDATTASGRLQRGMLGELAAFESERTGEVWKETHARRRKAGLPAQGGGRYGYVRDGDSFTPHPEQGPVLRWMYEAYVAGDGFASIARELNGRGLRNRLGRLWQTSTVKQLMESGFAAGLIVHGKNTRHPVFHPGRHEALIDSQLWARYRSERQRRKTEGPRVTEPRYPLTGLIQCGDCLGAMHPTPGGTSETGHTYLCSSWIRTGQGRCVTVVRHRAEKAVLDWLQQLRDDLGLAAEADGLRTRRQTRARSTAGNAAKQVADIEKKVSDLTRRNLEGLYPDFAYRAARDELMDEHAAAVRRYEEAQVASQGPDMVAVQPAAAYLLDEWDTLTPKTRRNMLRHLVRHVRVFPPERRGGRARVVIVPAWDA